MMQIAAAEAVEDEQPEKEIPQHEEELPTQLAETESAPAQTTTQSLQQPLPERHQQPWEHYPQHPPFDFRDPTMKSPRYNLPSGLAKLLGIPHGPGAGDSDADFAALAKQVGEDGLSPFA